MSSDRDVGRVGGKGLNRRSFLQTSGGVATGLAVTIVPPAALALAAPAAAAKETKLGEAVHPEGDVPSEPVLAYVQDAAKGDVTVLSGTVEKTYRDPVLAKRLLDAARGQTV